MNIGDVVGQFVSWNVLEEGKNLAALQAAQVGGFGTQAGGLG